MIVREFRREDINRLEPQPEQKHEYELCRNVDFKYTVEAGGNVLAVLAYFEWGSGEYVVCSLISGRAGKYMLQLVRQLRCLIAEKAEECGAQKNLYERAGRICSRRKAYPDIRFCLD